MPSYRGRVYDLDFIEKLNWCQILLRSNQGGAPGQDELVAVTSDQRMQSVLETALIMSHEVEVEYDAASPNRLTRAKINIPGG